MATDDLTPPTETTRRSMRSNRSRDTGPELRLRRLLHAEGLRYFVDRAPLKGLRRRADLVFPRLRIAVYVDGCFWHGCPIHGSWPKANATFWREKIETNRRRDADTDRRLHEAGWEVVRVWEHEPALEAAERVGAVVARRRGALGRRRDGRDMVDEGPPDDLAETHGDGVADQPADGAEADRGTVGDEPVVPWEGLEDRRLPE